MNYGKMMGRVFRGLWYFPKTLYVNFSTFPFLEAVKMPIIVMGKTKFVGLKKGVIVIDAPIRRGMIKVAALKSAKSGVAVNNSAKFVFRNNGKLVFKGDASFGAGTSICSSGDSIVFGERFSCNVNCFFSSCISIYFGEDVLLGWNVNIRDDDGHPDYDMLGNEINQAAPVSIADHVWIASHVDILKGVTIAKGIIVGYRSLITQSALEENCIYAGSPAKVVKRNVCWQHN